MMHDLRHSSPWRRIVSQPLTVIVVISVFLRLSVALSMGDSVVELPGIFDQISYHNLALRVADGHGFTFDQEWWPITAADQPTAHWSFLYTLYLVLVYWVFGPHPIVARIIQASVVGILHPYIIFRIGETVFSRPIGLAASAVTAVYIYFFYYGAALMTEPFYITGILFSLYFAILLSKELNKHKQAKLALALGISIGIAILMRQVFLLLLPFVFLWLCIARYQFNRNLPLLPITLSLAVTVCFIIPITLYNYSRFGTFVLLNTNSGYAFFWGNHPIHGTEFIPILPSATYQQLIPEEVRHLDEAALDRELLKRGIQFVTDDPMRYVLLSLSRIPPYFMFWSSSQSAPLSNISRIGSFGLFLPFMIYGLYLGIKRARTQLLASPVGLMILFVVVYSLVHILTWTLIRYRLPVDAVLILFAGLALFEVANKVRNPRQHSPQE